MRYLDLASLENLNSYLSGIDVGDCVLNGRVEAYTIKPYKEDKRVLKDITRQYGSDTSPPSSSKSPIGSMKQPSTRKLLSQLIVTLNSSFPDYDFSDARPNDFDHVQSYALAAQIINDRMGKRVDKIHPGFQSALWEAVDEIIDLKNCDVYSYVPDLDSDVFSVGKIFSLNFFFVNRRLRRLLFITCGAVSKLHSEPEPTLESFMDMEESRPQGFNDYVGDGSEEPQCGSASSWMGTIDIISPSNDCST